MATHRRGANGKATIVQCRALVLAPQSRIETLRPWRFQLPELSQLMLIPKVVGYFCPTPRKGRIGGISLRRSGQRRGAAVLLKTPVFENIRPGSAEPLKANVLDSQKQFSNAILNVPHIS
jgi:hypothetical protein